MGQAQRTETVGEIRAVGPGFDGTCQECALKF
jgi:hypothetical protein